MSNTAWAYARLQYDPYKTRPLLKALASQVGLEFSDSKEFQPCRYCDHPWALDVARDSSLQESMGLARGG